MSVAFVGAGNLGGPMCQRLLATGHAVTVYDTSQTAIDGLVQRGAIAAASPADAARGAGVACVVVRDDTQAEAAIAGPGGLLAGLGVGAVVVLHSTVAPSTVARLATACTAAGVDFVDAGISGGSERAIAGTLVAVVGGDDAAVERCLPVVSAYASSVVRCGPTGAGMAAKLARNLAQYAIWCALFEAMELVDAAGVDLVAFAGYVRESGLPTNHDFVLGRPSVRRVETGGDAELAARLEWVAALGAKDLDDAFELAEELGVAVPMGRIARRRYAAVIGLTGDS